MLCKRIIPCLDVMNGRTVKGVNFLNLRDAGDPVELAARYALEGADELVFLDITATHEKRKTLAELASKVAQAINIPFTVGGGIVSVEDAVLYYSIVKEVLGKEWLTNNLFRIGASRLANNLLSAIKEKEEKYF